MNPDKSGRKGNGKSGKSPPASGKLLSMVVGGGGVKNGRWKGAKSGEIPPKNGRNFINKRMKKDNSRENTGEKPI